LPETGLPESSVILKVSVPPRACMQYVLAFAVTTVTHCPPCLKP
jgi:hypothetical protein